MTCTANGDCRRSERHRGTVPLRHKGLLKTDESPADRERAVRADGAGTRGQHHHARAEHPAQFLRSEVLAPACPHPGAHDGRRGVRNCPGRAVRHLVALSLRALPRKAQDLKSDLTPVRPCCHLHLHRVGLHTLADATRVQLVGSKAAVRGLVPLPTRHHLPKYISREVQNSRGADLHRLGRVPRFRYIFDATSDGPQGAPVRWPTLLHRRGVLQVRRQSAVRARHLASVRERGHPGSLPRCVPVPLQIGPGCPSRGGGGRRGARTPRLKKKIWCLRLAVTTGKRGHSRGAARPTTVRQDTRPCLRRQTPIFLLLGLKVSVVFGHQLSRIDILAKYSFYTRHVLVQDLSLPMELWSPLGIMG